VIQALRNAWKLPDLRRRILFTMAILVVYRLGSYIFIPGIDQAALKEAWEKVSGNLGALRVVNVFSGGNFSQMTIFALGIQPYISASIILQLLQVVISLWDDRPVGVSVDRNQSGALESPSVWFGASHCRQPGSDVLFHHDADARRRNDLRHVAGRAD